MGQLMQLKVKGEFHEVSLEPWQKLLDGISDDIELTAHLDARTLLALT